MKIGKILEGLDLSPGEARVYQALLRIGTASVGPIARESRVSRSKIYEVVDKLIAKGLAGTVFKGKQRMFRATRPTLLLDLIKQKRENLEAEEKAVKELIPRLLEIQAPQKRVVELFEGLNGLKTAREELLDSMKKGDELLVLGAPRAANERWEAWFLDYHKRREKRGIGMRIIYNADTRDFGRIRKTWKYTEVKYLPKDFITPTWFDIFNDQVLIVVIAKGERPYALLVRDRSVAGSIRSYFEMFWSVSEK